MSKLQPPGEVATVTSERALVLAPHYDDEVFGCGGLVRRLADAGTEVTVLFLTDGAATAAGDEAAGEHSARRRAEAEEAAAVLGVARTEHLDLPDGRLARHLDELAAAITERLGTAVYDLLLVPSPLEISDDHRAAFAGLHRALAPVRDGDPLARATRGLDILAYEINHPLHPDLLVDVGAQLERVEEAIGCYASQLALHDYRGAALGLASFRTLTLAPEVRAAEAYRRLAVIDFSSRSLAQLVRHLGGVAERIEVTEGPKISVVVRTKDRPRLLAEALDSLAESHYRRVEVVLVNDGGEPPVVRDGFPFPVVRVELPEDLGRSTAAQAGVERASGDAVAFLDDDDLAAPEHLATLADLAASTGYRVVYTDAAVGVYELRSPHGWECVERRLPYSRDFDPDALRLDNYIPFNTLLIERGLFAEVGPFDPQLEIFEDWDYLLRLADVVPFHHLGRVTCEYRHFTGGGHHALGDAPRDRADFLAGKTKVLAKHAEQLGPDALARAVDALRADVVAAGEEASSATRQLAARRRELVDLSRRAEHQAAEAEELRQALTAERLERMELANRFHRARGELESLKGEQGALREALAEQRGELERLYAEEGPLRRTVDDQTEHLGRTYAEIERLENRIREMESTRAWRLHQWWSRRFR